MKSKVLSVIIATIYIIWAGMTIQAQGAYQMFISMIIPLSCIWWSRPIGQYTSRGIGRITKQTPEGLIVFIGWIYLLLVPVNAVLKSTG